MMVVWKRKIKPLFDAMQKFTDELTDLFYNSAKIYWKHMQRCLFICTLVLFRSWPVEKIDIPTLVITH